MREWLRVQAALLACVPRILAAVVTGNLEALDRVQADVDALHERWHGDG
jgi:hypothetical protein